MQARANIFSGDIESDSTKISENLSKHFKSERFNIYFSKYMELCMYTDHTLSDRKQLPVQCFQIAYINCCRINICPYWNLDFNIYLTSYDWNLPTSRIFVMHWYRKIQKSCTKKWNTDLKRYTIDIRIPSELSISERSSSRSSLSIINK